MSLFSDIADSFTPHVTKLEQSLNKQLECILQELESQNLLISTLGRPGYYDNWGALPYSIGNEARTLTRVPRNQIILIQSVSYQGEATIRSAAGLNILTLSPTAQFIAVMGTVAFMPGEEPTILNEQTERSSGTINYIRVPRNPEPTIRIQPGQDQAEYGGIANTHDTNRDEVLHPGQYQERQSKLIPSMGGSDVPTQT